jgi:hypothetical protein
VAARRKLDFSLLGVPGAVTRNDSPAFDGRPVADDSVAAAFAGTGINGARGIARYDRATNAVVCDAWATNYDALDD